LESILKLNESILKIGAQMLAQVGQSVRIINRYFYKNRSFALEFLQRLCKKNTDLADSEGINIAH